MNEKVVSTTGGMKGDTEVAKKMMVSCERLLFCDIRVMDMRVLAADIMLRYPYR